MKKYLAPLLAGCLLLTGCTGLPSAREMGDMALMRTMGVDTVDGGVEVTASTGPRASGLQGEWESALVLSTVKESLSAACLAMQGLSDSYVFYGYVDQLLLGEKLAQDSIKPVLDYFARDVELGLGTQLWLVRGETARTAVEAGGDEGVDRRLSTLQTDGKMAVAAISRTAGEVYTDLLEWGSTFAPALTPVDQKDGALMESGYGVLQGDHLLGFLDGELARGLEVLAGRASAEVMTVQLGENRVSARMTAAYTKPSLRFQGDTPSGLKINCRVDLELTEYLQPLNQQALEDLQQAVKQQELKRLKATLAQLRRWRADCVGLGAGAAMAHPKKWQKIQRDWPMWFGVLEPEVELKIVIHE